MEYRKHLQSFIDRWRYNANRAAQAQSKIKILEKLPELTPPEVEETETFKFPETEKIAPPLLQLNDVTFGYSSDKILLRNVNIDVGLDSRMAVVGPNGVGKSTLYVSLFWLSEINLTRVHFKHQAAHGVVEANVW